MKTQKETKRPDFITEKHLLFLDSLRESGKTNVFGAAPFLAEMFELDKPTARKVLTYWMESFGKEGR